MAGKILSQYFLFWFEKITLSDTDFITEVKSMGTGMENNFSIIYINRFRYSKINVDT